MNNRETIFKDFFLVASIFFKYFMAKLKIFLGIYSCTLDQRELPLGNENVRIDDKTKPCEVNSCIILFSCFDCMAFNASLVFRNWSYWMSVGWLVSFQRLLMSMFREDFKVFLMVV